jgi:hypothetical protein
MSFVAAPVEAIQPRVDRARANAGSRAIASTTAWAGICALIVVAPFEALQPIVRLPGQSLSSVETALVAVFGAWTLSLAVSRAVPQWRTPLTVPLAALVATMTVAALAAPLHTMNAMNMVGRLTLASCVYFAIVNGVTTAARLRGVFIAAAVAGAMVAGLTVLEYFNVAAVTARLGAFHARAALVGAQVRASGPFQYPTIASMFLEIVFAFVVALVPMAIDAGRRKGLAALGAAALLALLAGLVVLAILIGEAIVLTFTRAGLITMASTLAIVGWLRYRRNGFDRGAQAIAAIAVVIAALFLTSRSFESLRLRLTTETMDAWFRAEVNAPLRLEMRTGAQTVVPVTLTNVGGATWDSSAPQPFRLSYHWLLGGEDSVVSWEELFTKFPSPIAPGQSVSLDADVLAPGRPGEYRLMWDIEQEHRLWFSTEPDAPMYVSHATVSGPAVESRDGLRLTPLPRTAVRPGRLILWRSAARMVAGHPITGVGPDNYRLLYGPYAGLANFDTRVHSNNMYLEMLVGGGVLGGLAFLWVCWRAVGQGRTAIRTAVDPGMAMAVAGVTAAGVAIALHGLVDSFLSFTGTYILIATTLGLLSASVAINQAHAHRV